GIRDFHVTGVQTCALPIWSVRVATNGLGLCEVFSVLRLRQKKSCQTACLVAVLIFQSDIQTFPLSLFQKYWFLLVCYFCQVVNKYHFLIHKFQVLGFHSISYTNQERLYHIPKE